MRRIWAILGVLGGIAVIVAAFLPFVTKEGGNIATANGNIPSTLGGMDDWVGWVLLGAGVLILLLALVMLRARSRIVAVLLFLSGAVAAGVGIWALVDPTSFYVQVGALQAGEDADAISSILDQFEQGVAAESGAWVAAIGGVLAVLGGLALMVTPKRRSELAAETPTEELTDSGELRVSEPSATRMNDEIPPPPAMAVPDTVEAPVGDDLPAPGEEPAEAPSVPETPDTPEATEPVVPEAEAAEEPAELEAEEPTAPDEPGTQDAPGSVPPEPPDVGDWR
jgi:hypothetical protein